MFVVLTCLLQFTFPSTKCWSVALKGEALPGDVQIHLIILGRWKQLIMGKACREKGGRAIRGGIRQNALMNDTALSNRLGTMTYHVGLPKQPWTTSFFTLQGIVPFTF